ncbi:hypothetical protein F2P81_000138 [Scophthalmus maximus]|uniref:Uncharacterized protein n=1 Tax=Scophthalmus maximus TaxID=52904 RepID=A0A6A4TMG0_SCOMX|nr:hypothetical protein F2P81_000138 [Scophthalmus maximus]
MLPLADSPKMFGGNRGSTPTSTESQFMRIIFQTDVPSFQINRTKDEDELARRTSASAERSLAFVQR